MTGCRLECAWEVWPWILRVVMTFHWLRHNLNLRDALATLSVSRTDTVATRVTTTDYQHILTLGVNQFVLLYFDTGEHPVLLSEHFECEINTLEFASGNLQVAGSRSTGGDYVCVITLRQFRHVDLLTETELDALLFEHIHTTVDDSLVEFEVGDAISEQSTCSLVLVIHRHSISLEVELIGSNESGWTCTNHSHLLAVALRCGNTYEILLESHLGDGSLVLTVGGGLMLHKIQHASLLAESRTDTSGELREVVGGVEKAVSQLIVALIQSVVPLRRFVAQWASPMAEWHTAVHTSAGLSSTVLTVESLFHLSKVVNSIVYWPISCLLARNGQKCFRISHFSIFQFFNLSIF